MLTPPRETSWGKEVALDAAELSSSRDVHRNFRTNRTKMPSPRLDEADMKKREKIQWVCYGISAVVVGMQVRVWAKRAQAGEVA